MNTTKFYDAMVNAQSSFDADLLSLEKLRVLESAEALYFAHVAAKRAEWNAIPNCDRKISAEENANETESTDVDELRWFEVAIMGYLISE